jgi:hypothetical protein
MPSESFTFSFEASPGDRLSIAAMIVESNDYFVGFSDDGVALFSEDGEPISGTGADYVVVTITPTPVTQAK